MKKQLTIFTEKLFMAKAADITWYSEPFSCAGVKTLSAILECIGSTRSDVTYDIIFEGSNSLAEDAIWTTMTDNGTTKITYIDEDTWTTTDLYPYVRIKVVVGCTSTYSRVGILNLTCFLES